ncbi:MAG: mechanosensitive ion channel [Steroidobacteraceae bacterium]|nr:mechanosensitive ion channel [Steroidobacteraceae bacterium]
MHRSVGVFTSVLSLLALGWSSWSAAQDAGAPAANGKSGPEAVLPADIPLRADGDERFSQDVIERSRGQDPTARLKRRLDVLAESVLEESRHFKRDELQLLAIARLESLERHWNFYAKQLEAWRRDLQDATVQYTEDAAELARRRANWEATRNSPDFDGLAPALGDRVSSVIAQITQAERAVSGPIERQIQLSRSANSVETSIQAGQRAVTAAIAYNDRRLARIDSPPLWQQWNDPQSSGSALQSMAIGIAAEQRFMQEYDAATAAAQAQRTVLALLLLPLLLWLSRRSRKVVSDDPEIQASTRVLRRPISSWIILLMMGVVVFQPEAPVLLHQLALFLTLIPVLRLLPPKVYEVLGPWPYIATGLYLLNQLGFLFLANSLHHRLYLLGLTLLSAVLLTWLLWRSRPRPESEPSTIGRRVAWLVGAAAIAALLVSAVANVVGNVSLAEMLTGGILDSGYVGLVLYAGVTVLSSVIRLLLARRALSRFSIVTQHAGPLLHSFTRLLGFAAVAAWVLVLLNEFRAFRPIRDAVISVLTFELKFGEISVTLGGMLLFGFSVWLAFWVAKAVRLILQDEVLPKMSLPRGVGNSISSLSYYALLIAGLFVALVAAGFEVSQLTLVVGALGLGIGLGLQNVVNNFVSGLILMFERPIQPGDVVEVGGVSGKVREIGMRATTLSTFEGADVIVPNGMLLAEKLVNWTLSDMDRRIDVNVGVAYGTDPRRVLGLLKDVTVGTEGIATEPAPTVLFVGFGASSLDFAIRAWTNNFGDWVATRSNLTVRVYDALLAEGIEIPFPQQSLHVRSVAPAAAAALAGLAQPPGPRAG